MSFDKTIKLSVHELVDFLLRTGDIDNRVFNEDTRTRGSEIHSFYQKKRAHNYQSEYYLSTVYELDDFTFNIDGRADGIYLEDIPVIEEIKSANEDLDVFYKKNKQWHLGQALVYAYMYLKEKSINNCEILLTYISQIDDSKKEYRFKYTFKKLEDTFQSYLKEYLLFYKNIYEHKIKRNESSEKLLFPFNNIRDGQKKFISLVNNSISSKEVSFIEAPTGIGKTIASLYPSVKSFHSNNINKIFYLTAKNTGKDSAYLASSLLINKGLEAGVIYITAKEKICASLGKACNPDECPFAVNYYSKLKKALLDAFLNNKLFNDQEIRKIALRHKLCPFEFSLDLSNYMDIIIADYNYFFDPLVHLERYFDNDASDHVVLVDEAHNLLDRASEMYSETLSYSLFKECMNDYRMADKKLRASFNRLNKLFKNILNEMDLTSVVVDDIDHEIILSLNNLSVNLMEYLKDNSFHPIDASVDFSRRLNRFLYLYQYIDDTDILFYEKSSESEVSINLYCLDSSKRIRESLNKVRSSILFSATLSPINYYKDVLGGNEIDNELLLPSPFPKDNFKLLFSPISIKYKDRDLTLGKVIALIKAFTNTKIGNYLIYSPSFEYLDKLKPYFVSEENVDVIFQDKDMNDFEKRNFIEHFLKKKNKSVIGFCVVGGAFAEGIDLVSDSLIGVVVIGVGLPTISFRRNLIKDYYINKGINGYSYAYKHPGMNKVSQAVGRLIRSENDIGAALLIDQRYLTNEYRKLFKDEWKDYDVVTNEIEIKNILNKFWNK